MTLFTYIIVKHTRRNSEYSKNLRSKRRHNFFDGEIYGEAGAYTNKPKDSIVILTSPEGETLKLVIGFCTRNPEGWSIAAESNSLQTPAWPIRFVPRPNHYEDPAVEIDVPNGTIATCDGELVQ